MELIKAEGLGKNFSTFKKDPGLIGSLKSLFSRKNISKSAVADFDLTADEGEIIGLLGPNGAGKTTLIKMFSGIIVPSSGKLEVIGCRPEDRSIEFRKKIALVMGQKSQLWWDIPAMDSFYLLKSYYELSDKDFNQRVDELATLLGLNDLLHVHIRKLSLGERMKMELMAGLLHRPKVIFLDEPTIGLDLLAQDNIRQFIQKYHSEHKTTIILTSHYMADVKTLCKRLVLVFDGRKRYDGSIHDFEKILGSEKSVSFIFSTPQTPTNSFWTNYKTKWSDDCLQVELSLSEHQLREVSGQVISQFPVHDFHTEKLPIERVMKELMRNPQIFKEELNGHLSK